MNPAPASGHARDRAVRPPAFAGSWYPGRADALAAAVDEYLALGEAPGAGTDSPARPFGLVVPHAGYRYSGRTAGRAFAALRAPAHAPAPAAPRRVLLLGPSHRGWFRGLAVSRHSAYATPLGEVPLDAAAADALLAAAPARLASVQPAAEAAEHSLEIELPFLQRVLGAFALLPVMVGELAPDEYPAAAELLRPLLDDRTVVVASSDFTHYGEDFGYVPFRSDIRHNLEGLDAGAIAPILDADPGAFLAYQQRTGITVCGYRPIALLLHLASPGARGRRLDYATSGDASGDFEHCVTYAAIRLDACGPGVAAAG
ncbi:MAG: AmmeMemoRadiSam system protein B [Planctomycetes bacterium]|nr:AmmeMemoRadiSam system protein B [Planctomycetota bacterium]